MPGIVPQGCPVVRKVLHAPGIPGIGPAVEEGRFGERRGGGHARQFEAAVARQAPDLIAWEEIDTLMIAWTAALRLRTKGNRMQALMPYVFVPAK